MHTQTFTSFQAMRAQANCKRKGPFRLEDVLFFLRKDRKHYSRVLEILRQKEEITRARCPVEMDREGLPREAPPAPGEGDGDLEDLPADDLPADDPPPDSPRSKQG